MGALGEEKASSQKVITYVEYRAVSGVFQNIDPPPPSQPSECVLPPHQRWGGVHTRRVVRGWGGGFNFLEDATHWIGLLQYNPSTPLVFREVVEFSFFDVETDVGMERHFQGQLLLVNQAVRRSLYFVYFVVCELLTRLA